MVFTMNGGEMTAADGYEGMGIVAEDNATLNINNATMSKFKNDVVSVFNRSNVIINMDGCTFTNNVHSHVIYVDTYFNGHSCTLDIKNCLFKNNTGWSSVGLFSVEDANIRNTTFIYNNNFLGTVNVIDTVNMIISKCNFSYNTVQYSGGGLHAVNVEHGKINSTIFKYNKAVEAYGGAIFHEGGNLNVENDVVFEHNTAQGDNNNIYCGWGRYGLTYPQNLSGVDCQEN